MEADNEIQCFLVPKMKKRNWCCDQWSKRASITAKNPERFNTCGINASTLRADQVVKTDWGCGTDNRTEAHFLRVTVLTSVSPESTSSREMRLCPSLRSSYRSVTCLWAWGHMRMDVIYLQSFILNLLSASVVNFDWLRSQPELFKTPTDK